mgnify:CR=1 FL=1
MKELSEVLKDWEAVIGLEIHTELTTLDTKMFCGCKLSHDDEHAHWAGHLSGRRHFE